MSFIFDLDWMRDEKPATDKEAELLGALVYARKALLEIRHELCKERAANHRATVVQILPRP